MQEPSLSTSIYQDAQNNKVGFFSPQIVVLDSFFKQYNIQKYNNLNHSLAPVRIRQKPEASCVYNQEGAFVWTLRFYEGLVDNFQAIFMALIFPKESCPDSSLNPVGLTANPRAEAMKLRQCSALDFNWSTSRWTVLPGRQHLTSSSFPMFCQRRLRSEYQRCQTPRRTTEICEEMLNTYRQHLHKCWVCLG